MRPTLLLGSTGQVGSALHALLARSDVRTMTPARSALDLSDLAAVRDAVRVMRPRVILNAAAYTAVDQAESQPALARTLNADLPAVLGEEARALDAIVVHYSTDYVFAGDGTRPYREDDPTGPLGVYGATKLQGEAGLVASGARHLTFRTSWVFHWAGRNFVRTMLRLARQHDELRVVADQHGVPTSADAIAGATMEVLAQASASDADWGTYHMVARGDTTWHAFAEAILAADPRRHEHRARRVVPISTDQFPTPARRPAYSVLDPSRLDRTFGVALEPWQAQLAAVLRHDTGARNDA
jgi:dTDP-4-dehydrorhamnose reductase